MQKSKVTKREFFTTTQFAAEIGITRQTLVKWDKKGFLKPHHVSPTGLRYYSHEQVSEYLNKTKSHN